MSFIIIVFSCTSNIMILATIEHWLYIIIVAAQFYNPYKVWSLDDLICTGLVCSTISSKLETNQNNVITMQATLISPVAGTIYFRKHGDEPTIIHGKLFWINEMTTASVEWSIYDDRVSFSIKFCASYKIANSCSYLMIEASCIIDNNFWLFRWPRHSVLGCVGIPLRNLLTSHQYMEVSLSVVRSK